MKNKPKEISWEEYCLEVDTSYLARSEAEKQAFHAKDELLEWHKQRVEQLEEENKITKKAMVFSRQYYHLPQEVYDIFSKIIPEDKEDKLVSRGYLDELDNFLSKPRGEDEQV